MSCPMLRGYLKIIVLKALAEGPKSGYSLMKYVEDKVGSKPSPGSIYPLLDALKTDEFVTVKGVGRTSEYKLTAQGKLQVTKLQEKRDECLRGLLEGMKMLSTITGEDMTFPMTMMESLRRGEIPFKEINPEWNNLRLSLFDLMRSGELKKKSVKIRTALSKAYKEMHSI